MLFYPIVIINHFDLFWQCVPCPTIGDKDSLSQPIGQLLNQVDDMWRHCSTVHKVSRVRVAEGRLKGELRRFSTGLRIMGLELDLPATCVRPHDAFPAITALPQQLHH